ncbi:MAG: hypothetical protein ACREBG_20670 [Pyrinomonadaceae bacterium]
MQIPPRVKEVVRTLRKALVTFLRGLVSLLEASRLLEGLYYSLASFLVLSGIALVGPVLNWALAWQSVWVGFTFLGMAAVLLILLAGLMTNEQFLKDVQLNGFQWPSLLSIALAWFAVVVFGGFSCGFERIGKVDIQPSVPFTEGCATRYADLYLWHLFDSIPAIKFTETIGWRQRYTCSDKLSGWLLVLFKVLVFVSVIGSFVACGRIRREAARATRSMKKDN